MVAYLGIFSLCIRSLFYIYQKIYIYISSKEMSENFQPVDKMCCPVPFLTPLPVPSPFLSATTVLFAILPSPLPASCSRLASHRFLPVVSHSKAPVWSWLPLGWPLGGSPQPCWSADLSGTRLRFYFFPTLLSSPWIWTLATPGKYCSLPLSGSHTCWSLHGMFSYPSLSSLG